MRTAESFHELSQKQIDCITIGHGQHNYTLSWVSYGRHRPDLRSSAFAKIERTRARQEELPVAMCC